MDDRQNGVIPNTEVCCQSIDAASFGVKSSDFENLFFAQDSPTVFVSSSMAFLLPTVGVVIGASAKEQMVRSNTGWNITFVENAEVIWHRTIYRFPGPPMSQHNLLGLPRGPELAVPFFADNALPEPAGFGLFDLAPEQNCGVRFHCDQPIIQGMSDQLSCDAP